MRSVTVTKHHGLGNDFLVLVALPGTEGESLDVSFSAMAELARAVCDRHRGIGADGLLLALAVTERERVEDHADVRMRLHNADGSVAEMSGNGIRCFVQGLLNGGHVQPRTIRVLTDAGLRVVQAHATDAQGISWIRVEMGRALINSIVIPQEVQKIVGERRCLTVDVGNPHIVIADDLANVEIATFGPAIEKFFMESSGGINVEVVSPGGVRSSANGEEVSVLNMAVWERGVGVTQACGTGAVASAVAAHSWGLIRAHSEVRQPGGNAGVEIDGDRLTLIGPSQNVATCVFSW
jgi:diaminopimelate epimerase